MTHVVSRGLQTNHQRPQRRAARHSTPPIHTCPAVAPSPPSPTAHSARVSCSFTPSTHATSHRSRAQTPPIPHLDQGSASRHSFNYSSQLFNPLGSLAKPPRQRSAMSNAPSRTATPSRDTGSHTLEETHPNPVTRLNASSGVLRLRAEPEERRHIQWAEDVIDNEGMGKKSSKGTLTPPSSSPSLCLAHGVFDSAAPLTQPWLTDASMLHIPRPPRSWRIQ